MHNHVVICIKYITYYILNISFKDILFPYLEAQALSLTKNIDAQIIFNY